MEKKRDKNNNVKKVDINGKVKVIYCNPSNKRVEYVRANGRYMKLVDYKKMQRKSKKYRGGVPKTGITYRYRHLDGKTIKIVKFHHDINRGDTLQFIDGSSAQVAQPIEKDKLTSVIYLRNDMGTFIVNEGPKITGYTKYTSPTIDAIGVKNAIQKPSSKAKSCKAILCSKAKPYNDVENLTDSMRYMMSSDPVNGITQAMDDLTISRLKGRLPAHYRPTTGINP